MAVDIRLVDVQIRKWRGLGERLVSQRGWVDQFVFGAVQGFSYLAMDEMLRTKELSSATAYIHLTCQASVAHERIRNDEGGDKFETLDFMVRQEQETRRCFEAIRAGEAGLESFSGAKHWLLDTTQLTMAETLIASGEWLASVGIA
jgi:hypothetical protein